MEKRLTALILILALSHFCGCSRPSGIHLAKIVTDKNEVVFEIEVADTPEKQQRGLMYRTHLPEGSGMLFVFDDEKTRSFWMKNTYISLDIIFISANGKIVDIAPNTTPLSESPIRSALPAQYVLEIKAGLAEKHQIRTGNTVTFI